jgi:tetratricopeptide (TPR) repeat protein
MVLSMLCIAGLGFLFKTNPFPEGKLRIVDLANMGSIYLNNDKPDDDLMSVRFYKRASVLSQSLDKELQETQFIRRLFHDYYHSQAIRYAEGNENTKALNALENSLAYEYGLPQTHINYAKQLLKMEIPEGALREALEALQLKPDSEDIHLLLGTIYNKLPHSPYWLVFHWENALEKMESLKHETLNKTLIQIRNQLGISEPMNPLFRAEQKDSSMKVLSSSLAPIIKFSADPIVPESLVKLSPEKMNQYMMMLYQRLVLFPEKGKADIHYQLGILYWKKENRLSAAVHHLEKAWVYGRQSVHLLELNKLHAGNLSFDNSE